MANGRTLGLALPQKYLLNLLKIHSESGANIRATVYTYYKRWIFKPIQEHRLDFIDQQNRRACCNRQIAFIESNQKHKVGSLKQIRNRKLGE